jgi:hypothetical protein
MGLRARPLNIPSAQRALADLEKLRSQASVFPETLWDSLAAEVFETALKEEVLHPAALQSWIAERLKKNIGSSDHADLGWRSTFMDKKLLSAVFINSFSLLVLDYKSLASPYEEFLLKHELSEPSQFIETLARHALRAVLTEPSGLNDPQPGHKIFRLLQTAAAVRWSPSVGRSVSPEAATLRVGEAVLRELVELQKQNRVDEKLLERTLFNVVALLGPNSQDVPQKLVKELLALIEQEPLLRQSWQTGLIWRLDDPNWSQLRPLLQFLQQQWLDRRVQRCQQVLTNSVGF